MQDKLNGLESFLIKVGGVPGLGFLRDQARALTRLRFSIGGRIRDVRVQKDGFKGGAEAVGDVLRPKTKGQEKGARAPDPDSAAGEHGAIVETMPAGEKVRRPTPTQASKAKQKADLKAQKKLAMQKLRR